MLQQRKTFAVSYPFSFGGRGCLHACANGLTQPEPAPLDPFRGAGGKGPAAPLTATNPKRLPMLALFLVLICHAFAYGNAPRKTKLRKGKPSPRCGRTSRRCLPVVCRF